MIIARGLGHVFDCTVTIVLIQCPISELQDARTHVSEYILKKLHTVILLIAIAKLVN